jgi:hypothetical protein
MKFATEMEVRGRRDLEDPATEFRGRLLIDAAQRLQAHLRPREGVGGSAKAADGVAGRALLGLLAVDQLGDQAVGGVAEGGDFGKRRVVDGQVGGGEDADPPQHRPGIPEQHRRPA